MGGLDGAFLASALFQESPRCLNAMAAVRAEFDIALLNTRRGRRVQPEAAYRRPAALEFLQFTQSVSRATPQAASRGPKEREGRNEAAAAIPAAFC